MDGINKVTILGNLGADPELRVLPGGNSLLKLRVATNESWLDKDKNKQERTEWHRVTVFGRRAEALSKFARKGMKVFVEGRNQTSSYDKEGQKHYSTEVIGDQVLVFGAGHRSAESAAAAPHDDAPFAPLASQTNGAFSRGPESTAMDIPF
jgi:single-strand DNA-binding protein